MTKVVIVKANSYDTQVVEQVMQDLLAHLGGIERYINAGERVLVKPNMLEAVDKASGVTTHPEVVRAVVRMVKSAGAIPVVGDSPGVGNLRKVAEKCGIWQVCQEEGVLLVSFNEIAELALPEGILLKKLNVANVVTEVDKVISLAKMKTHSFMGVTGAVKNLFGLFVGTDKAQFHLRMKHRTDFARMLVDLYRAIKPVLSIVDGITGMEGAGPRNGQVVRSGVLLAGSCGFSVDLVMADIMGFDAEQMPVAQAALAAGLSPALAAIDRVGSGKDEHLHFKEPRNFDSLERKLPGWLVDFSQNQFTAKPLIDRACIGCGRCAEHCPPKAIRIIQGKAVIDYRECIRCYCCQELCPADAVSLSDGRLLRLVKWLRER
ncbi:DUF362 domain-containing protein [Propionispora hippei]|uniref:Uncharacterized conserved protein, DUF362 family n=1 Tax=Propionispora hippei DSM 15287 TaxID=1123003 RepID=A0A1M6IS52_9FIRM|nr:DUF362 domain-containing protein [Propionispora hippei]SHJ37296.1 Uncharacterized conserved protein, DUF362 family [Propionispora hippei DSM 15287]